MTKTRTERIYAVMNFALDIMEPVINYVLALTRIVLLTVGIALFGYATFLIVTSIPEWVRNEGLWPSTLHVQANIGAPWLPDEERACLSWTDSTSKQTVDVLDCSNDGERSAYHNIPIEFTARRKPASASSQKPNTPTGDPRLWRCRRVSRFLADYYFACQADQ